MVSTAMLSLKKLTHTSKTNNLPNNLSEIASSFSIMHAMVKQTNELYELAGQELMEAAKKQTAAAKVPVHYETLVGNAAQQILTAAKKSEASMILIGSRGMNAVAEFILGSVSSKVAMYAEIPVLIVK